MTAGLYITVGYSRILIYESWLHLSREVHGLISETGYCHLYLSLLCSKFLRNKIPLKSLKKSNVQICESEGKESAYNESHMHSHFMEPNILVYYSPQITS